MKAVVTGMIATYPVGGVVWDYAQYALGLERLGFDVVYLEDPGVVSYDPVRSTWDEDCTYGVDFLARSLAALSPRLGRAWHYRAMDGRCFGLTEPQIAAIVRDADVLINVSGGTLIREIYMPCRNKVLIDTDPGWNHFNTYPRWDSMPDWYRSLGFRSHDHYFTYALNIGGDGCDLPLMDIKWRTTRPPVICDLWLPQPPGTCWTTVMSWKSNYPSPIRGNGRAYGAKEVEFSAVEELPLRTAAPLEMAVGGSAAPIDRWRQIGWSVLDAHDVSTTHEDYRRYIERSRGEFSVAKNVYVATHSGWFSCRSVCYLAASRPVVMQDTGFSGHLPVGCGLLPFNTLDEAADAIDSVERDYERHARVARRLAESLFSADVVLREMLDDIGLELGADRKVNRS